MSGFVVDVQESISMFLNACTLYSEGVYDRLIDRRQLTIYNTEPLGEELVNLPTSPLLFAMAIQGLEQIIS